MEVTQRTPKPLLLSEYRELEKRYEALRRNVVAEAMRGVKEHGWCDEVNDILDRLGLSDLVPKVKVTLSYEVTLPVIADAYSSDYLVDAKEKVGEYINGYGEEDVAVLVEKVVVP